MATQSRGEQRTTVLPKAAGVPCLLKFNCRRRKQSYYH